MTWNYEAVGSNQLLHFKGEKIWLSHQTLWQAQSDFAKTKTMAEQRRFPPCLRRSGRAACSDQGKSGHRGGRGDWVWKDHTGAPHPQQAWAPHLYMSVLLV